MVKVHDLEWYEDKIFKQNLDIWLDGMMDNDDLVLVFDGLERSGKSLRMRQVAKYCASVLKTKFDDTNIFFQLNDYVDFSIESSEYTICILDEGRNVLNKKSSMSKGNKKFTNYISECAKKRQVHLIALPAYHDLDRYISNWRMKAVVHLHKWYENDDKKFSGYKLSRGKYTFYMNDDYLKDSYNYPYRYPRRWETIGRFNNIETFSKNELKRYEDKKDENMEIKYHSKYENMELNKTEQMWKKRTFKLANHCELSRGLTRGEISDALGMELKNFQRQLEIQAKAKASVSTYTMTQGKGVLSS